MTRPPAPALSPAEVATVARFDAADDPAEITEARETVERVAAALRQRARDAFDTPCDMDCDPEDCASCGQPIQGFSFINDVPDTIFGDVEAIAAAAIAAMPPSPATCGDLSPTVNFGGDADAERLMCDLPVNHGGAHQHDNGDGLPPTRWVARGPSPAEEAEECEHHSWAGLMALLDEHWPDDIFPTREDDVTRDAGARVVSLIRWVDRLRAALASPAPAPRNRYAQCDDTCTVDCGACKGGGPQ